MPKFNFEHREVIGGMIRDLALKKVPKNKYYNAENINLTPNVSSTLAAATAMLGSDFAVNLGSINFETPDDDYEAWMLQLDLSATGILHDISYNNGVLQTTTISSAQPTPALRYADLVTQINSAISGWGLTGSVYIAATPISGVVNIGVRVYGYSATMLESIDGNDVNVIILKEFYGNDNGFFVPLKSIYIDTDLYIISTNGTVTRLGVAQKNYATGAWTYTVLLQTNQIQISTTAVIDMDGQIDFGERVSIYFTTDGIPRCFYVKRQSTWVANSAMMYYDSTTENTDGYYTYNSINAETGLQVLENFANITYDTVYDTGGSLTTGNKQYFVRQLAGDETTSGISVGSGFVSIYSASQTDNNLYGNVGGEPSSKRVSLNVFGLNPNVYDKFQLIVVDNVDGVFTGYIVNTFDITSTTMTVEHTGSESYIGFDLSGLSTQQVLVKNAQNLVIARNRLFISNIETQGDYDLADWAQGGIAISTVKKNLDTIGPVTDNVAEYQLTENIFKFIGYMNNETYRFGIQLFFKNGFVSSPYFISDYTIDASIVGVDLTDGGTSTPSTVWVFNPSFDVDLEFGNPTVDGVPLKDAIYGYSIVRLDCIPEVLASGYAIVASSNGTITDYYLCGSNLANLHSYSFISTDDKRKQLSFYSPDILFGTADITPLAGDKVYNYGQVGNYNLETMTEKVSDDHYFYSLAEMSCSGLTGSPTIHEVQAAEVVPFNSEGSVSILTKKLSTLVQTTYPSANYIYGNNQRVLALESDTFLNPNNVATDYGFYYAQYIRPLTNKYGNQNSGNYKSCGHFRTVDGTGSFTDLVYGGDVFNEKSFTKFCNASIYRYSAQSLSLTLGGSAAPPFDTGTYNYYMFANFNDGTSLYLGTNSIVRTIGDVDTALTISCDISDLPEVVRANIVDFSLYRTEPASPIVFYLLDTTLPDAEYLDDNSGTFNSDTLPSIPATTDLNVRTGLSYYTQNRGNYQLRYFLPNTSDDYPYTTQSLKDWIGTGTGLVEGQLNYSDSYSPLQPQTAYRLGYDPNLAIDTVETNIVYYSDLKVNDSLLDPFRTFLPINRKAYPAKYGAITNMFLKDVNYLVIMMNEQVFVQILDQQQTTVDGTAIILGDGTVLGAQEKPISNIGSPIKTGASQYKNSAGQIHVAWYNPYSKKIMRYTGGSIQDLGETTNNQSFLTKNNQFVLSNNEIVMGYDLLNDELLITTITDVSGATEYSALSTYSADDIVWVINSVNQKSYFKALINVPIGIDPTDIENQVQYWERYNQSNYTLVFNDKLNEFSGFDIYSPIRYFTFNETFLTQVIIGTPSTSALYEHNKGLLLYGVDEINSSVTFICNDLADFYKAFRTAYFDINEQPIYVKVKTANEVTFTTMANIMYSRPLWGANVYNDATISVDNPSGLNTIKTAQLAGQFCEVTVWFKNTSADTPNKLMELVMKMIPRPKYFNN